jgi:excisionase family DNA binding protein
MSDRGTPQAGQSQWPELRFNHRRVGNKPVTSGVTDREPPRPSVHRSSQSLLTVGNNYNGVGHETVANSPTAPSVTSVTIPFAALVLQALEQSERMSSIVAGGGERFLSVREVADLLRACTASVCKLVSNGSIRSVRIGQVIRVRLRDLEELARGMTFDERDSPAPVRRGHQAAGNGFSA